MSKLKALMDDLRALPEKQSRKDLVGTLDQMRALVEKAAADLEDTLGAARHAEVLVEATQFSKAREHASTAINQAEKLRRLVGDTANIRADGPANTAVTLMREKAAAAKKSVGERWKARVENLANSYDALTRAAEQAQLKGREDMRLAVKRLAQAAARPPATAGEALKVRNDRDAVRDAVERLGLKGGAGQFLVAASQGRAEAKNLRDREVLDFLETHPDLWDLLKVSLA